MEARENFPRVLSLVSEGDIIISRLLLPELKPLNTICIAAINNTAVILEPKENLSVPTRRTRRKDSYERTNSSDFSQQIDVFVSRKSRNCPNNSFLSFFFLYNTLPCVPSFLPGAMSKRAIRVFRNDILFRRRRRRHRQSVSTCGGSKKNTKREAMSSAASSQKGSYKARGIDGSDGSGGRDGALSRLLEGGSPEKQLSRPNGVDLSNDGDGSAPNSGSKRRQQRTRVAARPAAPGIKCWQNK